jgi:hypothetical protein
MPYIYSLLNCLICVWYALPFVSYGVVLVGTVNTIGAAFQLAYTAVFIAYADAKKRVGTHRFSSAFCVSNLSFPAAAAEGVHAARGRVLRLRPHCVCQYGTVRSQTPANFRRLSQRRVPHMHVRLPFVDHCESCNTSSF